MNERSPALEARGTSDRPDLPKVGDAVRESLSAHGRELGDHLRDALLAGIAQQPRLLVAAALCLHGLGLWALAVWSLVTWWSPTTSRVWLVLALLVVHGGAAFALLRYLVRRSAGKADHAKADDA